MCVFACCSVVAFLSVSCDTCAKSWFFVKPCTIRRVKTVAKADLCFMQVVVVWIAEATKQAVYCCICNELYASLVQFSLVRFGLQLLSIDNWCLVSAETT